MLPAKLSSLVTTLAEALLGPLQDAAECKCEGVLCVLG